MSSSTIIKLHNNTFTFNNAHTETTSGCQYNGYLYLAPKQSITPIKDGCFDILDNDNCIVERHILNEISCNDGVMGLSETTHDGKVNSCVADYALNHTRSETLKYNNKLYFGVVNPKQVHKDQYNTNRNFILEFFKYKDVVMNEIP